jgi:hypothetical protein
VAHVADAQVRNTVAAARARAGVRRRFRVGARVSSDIELAPPSDEQRASSPTVGSLSQCAVAVAQTPGEATGSLLRVGSEIAHRIRQATPVRLDAVAPSRCGAHISERAAAFPKRLYATASAKGERAGGRTRDACPSSNPDV